MDAANNQGGAVRKKKMFTVWQKRTKLSPITAGNDRYTKRERWVHSARRSKAWVESFQLKTQEI